MGVDELTHLNNPDMEKRVFDIVRATGITGVLSSMSVLFGG